MADRISSTAVKREPGYLYYLGKDGISTVTVLSVREVM